MIAAEKKIPDKKYFLLFALHGAVAILTFFTNLVVKEVVIPSESQTQFIINEFVRGPSFIWIIGLMIFFSLFALFLTSKEIFLKKTKNNLFIGLGYLLSFFLLIYLIITESTDASNSPIIAFQLFPILTAALMGLIFYSVGILKKKKKTFMIVLTLFLILIMSVFGFNNYQTTKDIEEIIIDQEISALIAISQSRANHVETYMEQNIEKLKLITSRNKLRETAYSYILQKTPEKVETMNGILTSAKNSVQEIERVCVINLQGEIISSTNNSFIGKNVLEKEFFKKGLEKESIFFVEENGVLKIFTTGPIIFNKEKIGVGLMVVKTNYLKNIITNREGFGETGEVLIAIEDKKTGKINFLFERLFEEETANIKETNKTSALMKNTLEKRETSLSSDDLDYRNKKVLAASQFIELGEMGLITKRDFEEIDSQLKNESKKLWIQTIGILILLIVIAIISNFLINRSLKKEVKEKTAELDKNVGNLKDTKNALLNMMEDMDKANQDLKKLDKAKSEFLNITSHELKTPLTAMMAYIEILEDSKEKLNKTEKESLETIKRNAHNLKKLIGNILEIARMESGKFELIKTEINLKETVFEAIEDIKILAEKKGLEIVTKIDEKIPTLMMDQERVKEIVNNLVSNSVKFTEKGKITISAKKKAESIELIIEDTGKGIPKENLENLFKLFYQVDASISRKHEGTGLGLAITKKIVEAHGGEIKVESEANKGTKFIINFPLEKIKLK